MTITEPEAAMEYPISLRCNGDSTMLTLYDNCVECIKALGLKATYYGREAGGKTLALYDTDPGMTDVYNFPLSCTMNYKYIWLDDWYVYGSEADGRIATVDPKEIIAVNGSRMTGSEFPHPLNEYNASPPPDNLLPTSMRDTNIFGINASYRVQQRIPDFRRYEIKDHLGNVRTVIADYKNPDPATTASSIQFWRYKADVKNISNMYPYGKSYGTNAIYNASEDYRYGFNGMEKEKNMDASGDITDFGARVFDANFPVFLSPDPLEPKFGYQSTYVFAGNTPIQAIDFNGEHIFIINNQRKTIAAIDLAYATKIGKAYLDEFSGNEKHLIIFTSDIISDPARKAHTLSSNEIDKFVVDGKINFDNWNYEGTNSLRDELGYLEGRDLTELGINVKNGETVAIIELNNYVDQMGTADWEDDGSLSEGDLDEHAESIFHETIHELSEKTEPDFNAQLNKEHKDMGQTNKSQWRLFFGLNPYDKGTPLHEFVEQLESVSDQLKKMIIEDYQKSKNSNKPVKYKFKP